MDSYGALKLAHIVTASLLFGTGLATAFYFWSAHRTSEVRTIAVAARSTVHADWLFTLPAVILQPLTGFALLWLTNQDWQQRWVQAALALYAVAGACWLPVVWLQIRMHRLAQTAVDQGAVLPPLYGRYARAWFILGWPAFSAVLLVFGLMVFRPTAASPPIDLYAVLKLLHVVSAMILFGTAFGAAFHFWRAHHGGGLRAIAFATSTIVLVDWIFILPAVIVQPATGFLMLHLTGQDWRRPWLAAALAIFAFAGVIWFPLIAMQIRMRNLAHWALLRAAPLPAAYHRYLRWWMVLNVPVFLSALAIFALMVLRPALP